MSTTKRPGFSLIEILIALAIASTLLVIIVRSSDDMMRAVARTIERMRLVRQEMVGLPWIRADVASMVPGGIGVSYIDDDKKRPDYFAQLGCYIASQGADWQYATWVVYHDIQGREGQDMPVRVWYALRDDALVRWTYPLTTPIADIQALTDRPGGMVVCSGLARCTCSAFMRTESKDQEQPTVTEHMQWPLPPESTGQTDTESPKEPENSTLPGQRIPDALVWRCTWETNGNMVTREMLQTTVCAQIPFAPRKKRA